MNYHEALDLLKAASARGSRMGLERIRELAERLGEPQCQVKIVHIAGTNGKGSVGAMLASVLTHAGMRTGHFSSPAITSPRDFFRINTKEISEELFTETLTEVAAQAEKMKDSPTEYELLAAMAYTLFARQGCDIAVVECCMGGDTDCTNIIDNPLLSVITNVQLDHCAFLGETVAEIAAHKAGIIKQGCPVLFHDENVLAEANVPIRNRANALGAPLHYVREKGLYAIRKFSLSLDGTDFSYGQLRLHLPLLGQYQLDNAYTVLRAVELLRDQRIAVPDAAISEGLAGVRWKGRFELLHRDPVVIYDGAHNPAGMLHGVKQSLFTYFHWQKVVFLMGVMADKAYENYPWILERYAHCVFTVKPENPRALDAETLAEAFRNEIIPAEPSETLEEGVRKALACARKEQLPLVALGSLYMYREFCEALQKFL